MNHRNKLSWKRFKANHWRKRNFNSPNRKINPKKWFF